MKIYTVSYYGSEIALFSTEEKAQKFIDESIKYADGVPPDCDPDNWGIGTKALDQTFSEYKNK